MIRARGDDEVFAPEGDDLVYGGVDDDGDDDDCGAGNRDSVVFDKATGPSITKTGIG